MSKTAAALKKTFLVGARRGMIRMPPLRRASSQSNSAATAPAIQSPPPLPTSSVPKALPPLSLMPTPLLIRSYLLTTILASPRLLRLALPLLTTIANSPSPLLNPDRNPLIGIPVRKIVYDHFIAGGSEDAVRQTVTQIKATGFAGVVLGYAKEFGVGDRGEVGKGEEGDEEADVVSWGREYERTMEMVDEGDFVAVKLSGAGRSTLHALANQQPPPARMWQQLLALCATAQVCKIRVWIDAERQDLQPSIDAWTLLLMRRFNHHGAEAASGFGFPCVYNTYQAYLKSTPATLEAHMRAAQVEGWTLGVKLVRGAYMATERRELIWDSIEETHAAYDGIAAALLARQWPADVRSGKPCPRVALVLATHNERSVERAYEIQKARVEADEAIIELEFAQLQGMADELSCRLLQLSELGGDEKLREGDGDERLRPRAFKCLAWGSTRECLQFLCRRVKENGDAVARTGTWVKAFRRELWRRLKGGVRL
ncbi:proline dehydrogenase [Drepanopeziza brunnea f. sp. 'multigermtubi' MB_m1]|uniref:Proline dehydrogenase n=1 Tax=Marssonina brunnea f. sp. multigermtubi (strain MB_m1) TaxID=1072389 RepID=K1X6U5_MARBU|nr:proline dehydrogenase [Drepanopeziza brunnea f. sp. 'multigermtubi' MB_m1]EKD16378.1 proline dehydrogenase [Drepanopeziza brunnea f. sp. 'multigermtubi' MB_m1]